MEPVERHANRLVRKYSLTPPIDVEALIRQRAQLTYTLLPITGVSGLCMFMKEGPNKAHVFIDFTLIEGRKKFTLAHELGHLVIPWHVGSTVDIIDLPPAQDYEVGLEYYQIEAEANRFAAELLMPSAWVEEKIDDFVDLAELHRTVAQQAEVSLLAAAIRLARFLPTGIVWAMERDGLVLGKGQTIGTRVAGIWERDVPFDPHVYPHALEHYQWAHNSTTTHWWVLPSRMSVKEDDPREWREVLESVLIAQGYLEYDWPAVKQSLNGVIGAANSTLKNQAERNPGVIYSAETLAAACMQRFADSERAEFLQHPDMHLYIIKRAKDLIENPRKPKKPAF